MKSAMERIGYAGLVILCIGIFTSVSFSALSHVFLLISGAYFFYKNTRENGLPQLGFSSKFLLLMVVTIVISILFNWGSYEKPINAILKVKYFLIPLLSIFVMRHLSLHYLDHKRIKILINIFLVATTVASLSGIIGLYSGFNPLKFKDSCHATRACGLYGMYMTYGYGISLMMVLLTGALVYREKFKSFLNMPLLYLSWVVNFAGLFLSYARGGWLGFLLAVPFFFFKKNIKLFTTVVLASLIFGGIAFVSNSEVQKMFLNRGTSNDQRIAFYKTAVKAFQEKPVLGWGYRNFEPNVKMLKLKYNIPYQDFGGHAHNNILEHLASTGILGVIALLAFLLSWLVECYKRDDLVGKLSFPFVVSFLISGMFQYTFGDGENLFLIMGMWSLLQVRKKEVAA